MPFNMHLFCAAWIFAGFGIFGSLSAVVWQPYPGRQWSEFWQKQYTSWVEKEVYGNFFKRLGGHYENLPLDCADAAYAMRIYFSYQHRLPWVSDAPKWNRNEPAHSEQLTNWDHLARADDRVAHLIEYMMIRVNTRSLAYQDTYPVAPHDIRAGDLFLFKYGKEQAARHAYIIKRVNLDGTVDVLYSTQNRASRLKPLALLTSAVLQHSPQKPWGFKRFKNNLDAYRDQFTLDGATSIQYHLAERFDEKSFFELVENALHLKPQPPEQKLKRLFLGLCTSLISREVVVRDAVSLAESQGKKCFNYREFDALSTPSRDRGIKKQYDYLQATFSLHREELERVISEKPVKEYALEDKLRYREYISVKSIFSKNRSNDEDELLSRRCAITFTDSEGDRAHVHLGNLYDRFSRGKVSWHPNDNIARRWGVIKGSPTRCEAFYGEE